MGGRIGSVSVYRSLLVILSVVCLAPVLYQYSQTFVPANWQTAYGELTYVQPASQIGRQTVGIFRVDYEYKVDAESHWGSIYSVPIYGLNTLALHNRYNEGKLVVSYDPAHPWQSRAADIASVYAGTACLSYGILFCLGFTALTVILIGAVYGATLKAGVRKPQSAGAVRASSKTPVS